jgi:hypothetical protein
VTGERRIEKDDDISYPIQEEARGGVQMYRSERDKRGPYVSTRDSPTRTSLEQKPKKPLRLTP